MAGRKARARGGRKPLNRSDYRLENQVGFVLRQASQRHAAIFAELMKGQITPMQWAALVKLKELQGSSQNRLGRETAMDVATIKGVVDRLLARGLVKASQDPKDSRRVSIRLTEAGLRLVEENLTAARKITEKTLYGLSAAKSTMLVDLLRKIS